MAVLRGVCSGLFGFLLFWTNIFNFLFCSCFHLLKTCGVINASTSEGLALLSTRLRMLIAVRSCCWVRSLNITPDAWRKFLVELKASDAAAKTTQHRRPIYIMSNHVSFLDAMMLTINLPWLVAWRSRCYMSSRLLKFPIFGTVCRIMGHFPVYFLKNEVGKFSVDKERMAVVDQRVREHFGAGGILTLFPEGNLNSSPDPSVLQTFRHGTFKRAVQEDAVIWFFVMVGHHNVWPAQQPVALWPGRTAFGLYRVFKPGQGAAGAVAELRASATESGWVSPSNYEAASTDDPGIHLAEHCRVLMQERYSEIETVMKTKRGVGGGCCYVGCGEVRSRVGAEAAPVRDPSEGVVSTGDAGLGDAVSRLDQSNDRSNVTVQTSADDGTTLMDVSTSAKNSMAGVVENGGVARSNSGFASSASKRAIENTDSDEMEKGQHVLDTRQTEQRLSRVLGSSLDG